jgi:hypothetical protein
MAKHKLFCVPGTWEAVAAANGNLGGIIPGWTALRHSANHLNFWGLASRPPSMSRPLR